MATRIVVGAQWGDEGKGKMVDYLAQNADLIVRYQGGDNAGHTVVNDKGVFKLHLRHILRQVRGSCGHGHGRQSGRAAQRNCRRRVQGR